VALAARARRAAAHSGGGPRCWRSDGSVGGGTGVPAARRVAPRLEGERTAASSDHHRVAQVAPRNAMQSVPLLRTPGFSGDFRKTSVVACRLLPRRTMAESHLSALKVAIAVVAGAFLLWQARHQRRARAGWVTFVRMALAVGAMSAYFHFFDLPFKGF